MYSYKQIFTQALKVAFQHPVLWLLGFFAAFLGSAGEMELVFGGFGFGQEGSIFSFWQGLLEGGFFSIAGVKGFIALMFASPLNFFFISFVMLIMLVLTIGVVYFTVVSQVGLISQTVAIAKKKSASIPQAIKLGNVNFWPVFGINVLIKVFSWILFLVTSILALVYFPGWLVIFILIFDLFLLALVVASFIAKFAIAGIVLKGWEFKDAPVKAFALFKANWLLTLEVAFILFVINFFVNAIFVYFFSVVLFFALAVFSKFAFGLLLVLLVLFSLFVYAQIILAIFHWASWTIIFELLISPKQVVSSKLKKLFSKATS